MFLMNIIILFKGTDLKSVPQIRGQLSLPLDGGESSHPSPSTGVNLLITSPSTGEGKGGGCYFLISRRVISGRLKKRTGTCVVPIPRFTYIFVLPLSKSPLMKDDLLADLDFSIRKEMPIWPPCVCPAKRRFTSAAMASPKLSGSWASKTTGAPGGMPRNASNWRACSLNHRTPPDTGSCD